MNQQKNESIVKNDIKLIAKPIKTMLLDYDNEIDIFIINHDYNKLPSDCKMLDSTRTELIKKLIRKKQGDVFELNGIKYYINNISESYL